MTTIKYNFQSTTPPLFNHVKNSDLDALENADISLDDLYKKDSHGNSLCSYAQKNQSVLDILYKKVSQAFTDQNQLDLKKIDKKGRGLLHWAIVCKQGVSTIKGLVDAGADVNQAAAPYQLTPLYQAAQDAYPEGVTALLDVGADWTLPAINGATPLHAAAENGSTAILQALIDVGADVNLSCKQGAIPLFVAAQKNHCAAIELLINAGSDVNKPCANGATPLFVAVQNNHRRTVKQLLDAKADINGTLPNGATPLMIAKHFNHDDVIELLEAAGAA